MYCNYYSFRQVQEPNLLLKAASLYFFTEVKMYNSKKFLTEIVNPVRIESDVLPFNIRTEQNSVNTGRHLTLTPKHYTVENSIKVTTTPLHV